MSSSSESHRTNSRWQFTIGSFIRDVAIVAAALPGIVSPSSPISALFTAFAAVYFLMRIGFAITPSPSAFLLKSDPPDFDREDDDGRSVEGVDAADEDGLLEISRLLQRGDYDRVETLSRRLLAQRPEWLTPRYMLSLCLAARNHTNEARVEIVRVLEDERHDPLWNPPLWNNLAWVDLILGDPALHEEADHFSAMAYAASPETASIRGTRGAVLIEMGRIAEGMSLVLSAHDEHSLPRHRAFNAAHLAIGASATGREGQAAAYLERARAYDPNCPMIGRAQAALSRALEARRMTDT